MDNNKRPPHDRVAVFVRSGVCFFEQELEGVDIVDDELPLLVCGMRY